MFVMSGRRDELVCLGILLLWCSQRFVEAATVYNRTASYHDQIVVKW